MPLPVAACPAYLRLIAALGVLVPLLIACEGADEAEVSRASVTAEVPQVSVLEVQQRPGRHLIEAYGRLVAAEKVVIGVELAGTVAEVLFREGQSIEAGQLLLRLKENKQRLRLDRATADVATARAELARAQGTFERYRALIGRQVVSEEDFKQTEAAYDAAVARLQQALAAEKLAQQELRDLRLISPVDGIVESESVEPGQKVRPGDQLAVVQTTDSLQVVSYVTEREVNLLHPGDIAPMQTPGVPGREYETRIESIGSTAHTNTGNFAVKLRVDNSDGLLREGMSAQIQLRGREEQVMAVPRAAVVDRDRQRVVFVVRDGRVVRVSPSLGMSMGDWIPVLSGLSEGDLVAVDNLSLLYEGVAVQTSVAAQDTARQ